MPNLNMRNTELNTVIYEKYGHVVMSSLMFCLQLIYNVVKKFPFTK